MWTPSYILASSPCLNWTILESTSKEPKANLQSWTPQRGIKILVVYILVKNATHSIYFVHDCRSGSLREIHRRTSMGMLQEEYGSRSSWETKIIMPCWVYGCARHHFSLYGLLLPRRWYYVILCDIHVWYPCDIWWCHKTHYVEG